MSLFKKRILNFDFYENKTSHINEEKSEKQKIYKDANIALNQMIGLSNVKGIAGTNAINQYMHQLAHPELDNVHPGIMVGDKVIFTRTDYQRGYSNGDIGIIRQMDNKEIVFWNGTDEMYFSKSALADITMAYSYTIHKSQGSENPVVIIYLPEKMAHMMTRSLLYTAVTRAKNKVIIIYTGNALSRCVNNTNDITRQTRLEEFLQEGGF